MTPADRVATLRDNLVALEAEYERLDAMADNAVAVKAVALVGRLATLRAAIARAECATEGNGKGL